MNTDHQSPFDPMRQAQVAREREERLVLDYITDMQDKPVLDLLRGMRRKFDLDGKKIAHYLELWIAQ